MTSGAERGHRRSIRLKDFDYRQAGAYFVTICTQDRAPLLGGVVDGDMQANDAGQMVIAEWRSLTGRFPTVQLDAFVVMPNHVHGIIVLGACADDAGVGAGLVPAPSPPSPAPVSATTPIGATTRVAPTLGEVIGAFKSSTTVKYARGVQALGWDTFNHRLWQRNYYEHVIRNDESMVRIRRYIVDNPARWAFDRENPLAAAPEPEAAWRA